MIDVEFLKGECPPLYHPSAPVQDNFDPFPLKVIFLAVTTEIEVSVTGLAGSIENFDKQTYP
jgi:hypothetical protein